MNLTSRKCKKLPVPTVFAKIGSVFRSFVDPDLRGKSCNVKDKNSTFKDPTDQKKNSSSRYNCFLVI